jgi:hypothetical protein
VTVISTIIPEVPPGDVAVIRESKSTVKPVALELPNLTAVAPVKWLPVMITDVPPTVDPLDGEMPVTIGGGTTVTVAGTDVDPAYFVSPAYTAARECTPTDRDDTVSDA